MSGGNVSGVAQAQPSCLSQQTLGLGIDFIDISAIIDSAYQSDSLSILLEIQV